LQAADISTSLFFLCLCLQKAITDEQATTVKAATGFCLNSQVGTIESLLLSGHTCGTLEFDPCPRNYPHRQTKQASTVLSQSSA
jgi:hypothetical protein